MKLILYILLLFVVMFIFLVGIDHINKAGLKEKNKGKSALFLFLLISWSFLAILGTVFILDKVSYFILS